MRSLVALDVKPGHKFLELLNTIWEDNDAVLPIDQRLPHSAKQRLVSDLGASWIISTDGEKNKLDNGFQVDEGDALVIATSGTTGNPKGVVHTHLSITASVIAGGYRLGCSTHDHWLACLQVAHVGGMSVFLRARHYESQLSVISDLEQSSIDNAVKAGADLLSLVPTALQRLNVSSFRAVLVGGSATISDLPLNAISTYGLTETMGGVAYNGVALDGAEIRVTHSGEIEVRGDMLFRAYRDGTNPKDRSGWFSTGDLGEIVNGVLTVHGRRDDLINTGGYKVWPKIVEDSIRQIHEVTDCVVIGLPDEKWGTAVCAWIIIQDSCRAPNLDDLRRHVKKSLPDYCAPQKIFIVKQIPRTALGKVRTSELINLTGQQHE